MRPRPGGEIFAPLPAIPFAPASDPDAVRPAPAWLIPDDSPCPWDALRPDWIATVDELISVLAAWKQEAARALAAAADSASALAAINQILALIGAGSSRVVYDPDAGAHVAEILALQEVNVPDALLPPGTKRDAWIALQTARAYIQMVGSARIDAQVYSNTSMTIAVDMEPVIRVIDYLISYICPLGIPGRNEAVGMLLAGEITDRRYREISAANGIGGMSANAIARAQRTKLTPSDELRYWLRFRAPEESLHERLRRLGMTDVTERRRLIELGQYVPGPQDLIAFAVKDVYSDAKIGKAEMLRELAAQKGLAERFAAQGMTGYDILTADGRALRGNPLEDYWLAHYHNVSPTQAFEMLHRLRPNRVARFAQPGPDGKPVIPEPVTVKTVNDLLKEDDYNPAWRDRLAAISYRVPARVDVRRIYVSGGYGVPKGLDGFRERMDGSWLVVGPAEKELVEVNKDAGYPEDDAIRIARFTAMEFDKGRYGAAKAKIQKSACDQFTLGIIDRAKAIEILEDAGIKGRAAEAELNYCAMASRVKDVRIALKAIRRQYLQGSIAVQGVRVALLGIGISADKAGEYTRRWTLELAAQSKEATAKELCTWHGPGLLSTVEFRTRLIRIGYSPPDAERIIRMCLAGQAARTKAEREKAAKLKEKARKDAARVNEKARTLEEKRADRERATRLKGVNDKFLRDAWKARIIKTRDVKAALRLKGMTEANIGIWTQLNLKREEEGDGGDS